MTNPTKLELIKILEEREERKRYNLINYYKPYAKQIEFHNASLKYKELLLVAGNQTGKCATISTIYDTDKGSLPLGEIWGKDNIKVLTYPNNEPRKVIRWVKKPAEECYRITMSDGRWFECPKRHRILSTSGYVYVEQIIKQQPSFSFFRPLSSSVSFLSVRALNASYCFGILRGFLGRYFVDHRLYGGQLLSDEDNVQVFAPLQDGAQRHNSSLSCSDGLENKYTSILLRCIYRLSNLGVGVRSLVQSCSWLARASSLSFRYMTQSNQTLLLSNGFECHQQTTGVNYSRSYQFCSLEFPCIDGNHIVSIKPIGVHTLYDLEVEERHNYMAAGIVHHNTYAAAMAISYHTTGLYPDWWEGVRFKDSCIIWVAGLTGEVIRDTSQKLLVGRIDADQLGEGTIPKHLIVDFARGMGVKNLLDHVRILHKSGRYSIIYFKSYSSGREKFQGETVDLIWFDEEPAEEIYSEGLTRTNKGQCGQRAMLTYTPLLGMTSLTDRFMNHTKRNQYVVNMTINDVDHYTEQEKLDIIESYPAHERDARAKGIPILGSGRVFAIQEELITEEPLLDHQIPSHWFYINGLDFGWDHPSACVQLVYDRDSDVIHVTKAFKQRELEPIMMHAATRSWSDDIPTAWPHDGYQHDKGSGKQLARQYQDAGFYMLSEHATHEAGGNGLEAGILEMQERMKSGRWKVGADLRDWFEEFRMYHRKDGKIVKERDDILCACRYSLMMLRYADYNQSKVAEEYDRPEYDYKSYDSLGY